MTGLGLGVCNSLFDFSRGEVSLYIGLWAGPTDLGAASFKESAPNIPCSAPS